MTKAQRRKRPHEYFARAWHQSRQKAIESAHWIATNMETKVIMQTKKVIENKANMEIREIMEI